MSKSYFAFYHEHFGNKRFQFEEIIPTDDTVAWAYMLEHISLDQRFTVPGITEKDIEEMDTYKHPCWCCPELIYADDEKGNEVWLHKPVQ